MVNTWIPKKVNGGCCFLCVDITGEEEIAKHSKNSCIPGTFSFGMKTTKKEKAYSPIFAFPTFTNKATGEKHHPLSSTGLHINVALITILLMHVLFL